MGDSRDYKSFHDYYNSSSSRSSRKPTNDDDSELRSREMAADPMLEYFRQKEREKKGTSSRQVYKGPFPPNRYNIRPGYRWDGVDRSNGYEKRLIDKETDRKAGESESYYHATRDL